MPGLPLLSIAHCNVNCTDLVVSRRFYTETLGLVAGTHTKVDPQDGRGFGLDGDGAWDAWMLHDHRGPFTAPAIDLLEWSTPRPVGSPYSTPHHAGLVRLIFWVPDLEPVRERISRSSSGTVVGDSDGALAVHDPDGIQLLFWERPVPALEFRGVVINCTDLGVSVPWYERVLGVTVAGTTSVVAAGPRFVSPDDRPRVRLATLALPGQGGVFELGLERWNQTPGTAPAYTEANHVGIFRMAFMVDDIDAGYRQLLGHGVRCFSPPVTLDMGPDVPDDGLHALFFSDPDGACLELIETPTVR